MKLPLARKEDSFPTRHMTKSVQSSGSPRSFLPLVSLCSWLIPTHRPEVAKGLKRPKGWGGS